MIRNLIIGGALVASVVGLAPSANADEYDFISALDAKGVYYASISDMIDTGKIVCRNIRTGVPVRAVMDGLKRSGFPGYEAGTIVGAAANGMCSDIWPTLNVYLREEGYNV